MWSVLAMLLTLDKDETLSQIVFKDSLATFGLLV